MEVLLLVIGNRLLWNGKYCTGKCNIAQFVIIGVLVFFQFFSYTIDVLVSEAIIYFIMDALHVVYEKVN